MLLLKRFDIGVVPLLLRLGLCWRGHDDGRQSEADHTDDHHRADPHERRCEANYLGQWTGTDWLQKLSEEEKARRTTESAATSRIGCHGCEPRIQLRE